jgi:hypothetical protein
MATIFQVTFTIHYGNRTDESSFCFVKIDDSVFNQVSSEINNDIRKIAMYQILEYENSKGGLKYSDRDIKLVKFEQIKLISSSVL